MINQSLPTDFFTKLIRLTLYLYNLYYFNMIPNFCSKLDILYPQPSILLSSLNPYTIY